MNYDAYTRIAESHHRNGIPNQDGYAIKKHDSAILAMAISDGCSSMSDSHYTSIDLCRAAVSCETFEDLLGLEYTSFRQGCNGHATLVAVYSNGVYTDVLIRGDGLWGFSNHDGVHAVSLDWNDTPPYPTYEKNVLQQWDNDPFLTSIGNVPDPIRDVTSYRWRIPANWQQLWISSDGLTKNFSLTDIAYEISALKNRSGEFLKRRMSRWLKDVIAYDDITVLSAVREEPQNESMD